MICPCGVDIPCGGAATCGGAAMNVLVTCPGEAGLKPIYIYNECIVI